jgi:hypothetical protein
LHVAQLPGQLAIPIWQLVVQSEETQPPLFARATGDNPIKAETVNKITPVEKSNVEITSDDRHIVNPFLNYVFTAQSVGQFIHRSRRLTERL